MINRNLELHKDGGQYIVRLPRLDTLELDEMMRKYKGIVNIKIGRPASKGTLEQNAAMHSLLEAYFLTGMHSAPEPFNKSLAAFKQWIKSQYGPCYCYEKDGKQIKVLKSWADYTKEERSTLIEGLLAEIYASMAYSESDTLRKIIQGMEENKR